MSEWVGFIASALGVGVVIGAVAAVLLAALHD